MLMARDVSLFAVAVVVVGDGGTDLVQDAVVVSDPPAHCAGPAQKGIAGVGRAARPAPRALSKDPDAVSMATAGLWRQGVANNIG